jgi:hypothetical protein
VFQSHICQPILNHCVCNVSRDSSSSCRATLLLQSPFHQTHDRRGAQIDPECMFSTHTLNIKTAAAIGVDGRNNKASVKEARVEPSKTAYASMLLRCTDWMRSRRIVVDVASHPFSCFCSQFERPRGCYTWHDARVGCVVGMSF